MQAQAQEVGEALAQEVGVGAGAVPATAVEKGVIALMIAVMSRGSDVVQQDGWETTVKWKTPVRTM